LKAYPGGTAWCTVLANGKGWTELCIYIVCDRVFVFGDFPAYNIVYTIYTIYIWFRQILPMVFIMHCYKSDTAGNGYDQGFPALVRNKYHAVRDKGCLKHLFPPSTSDLPHNLDDCCAQEPDLFGYEYASGRPLHALPRTPGLEKRVHSPPAKEYCWQ